MHSEGFANKLDNYAPKIDKCAPRLDNTASYLFVYEPNCSIDTGSLKLTDPAQYSRVNTGVGSNPCDFFLLNFRQNGVNVQQSYW